MFETYFGEHIAIPDETDLFFARSRSLPLASEPVVLVFSSVDVVHEIWKGTFSRVANFLKI